ncbi:hypothetical protein JQK87_21395 [Streptomyces sp. G44]|uniref:hypothetical protein n=1 Tax=Streptomyces sp. G44 TaxID=2807632 RepID=UPI00195FF4D6|nr:hypothetical protein [Streptomyces sp. G44]MBM7170904.1 hypothetical protein [Streptomyces sp. G44]
MTGRQFRVDRGDTCTAVVARRRPDGRPPTHKLLSGNPARRRDAAVAGVRELLGGGDSAALGPGDVPVIETPGSGGHVPARATPPIRDTTDTGIDTGAPTGTDPGEVSDDLQAF